MDLNHFYAQHQVSLIRACGASTRLARTKHLAAAGTVANRIRDFQLARGAAAAASWLPSMYNTDLPATPTSGLAA